MPVTTARSSKPPDSGRSSLRGRFVGLFVGLAVGLSVSVAAAQAPRSEPPLPAELSVWNWLRQGQGAPQTPVQCWQIEPPNPYGVANQALWNGPAGGFSPPGETLLTAAVGSMADTRLDEGSPLEAVPPPQLIEAVPPPQLIEAAAPPQPVDRQRSMRSSPIQLRSVSRRNRCRNRGTTTRPTPGCKPVSRAPRTPTPRPRRRNRPTIRSWERRRSITAGSFYAPSRYCCGRGRSSSIPAPPTAPSRPTFPRSWVAT